jgi:hypothetical protein
MKKVMQFEEDLRAYTVVAKVNHWTPALNWCCGEPQWHGSEAQTLSKDFIARDERTLGSNQRSFGWKRMSSKSFAKKLSVIISIKRKGYESFITMLSI